MIDSRSDTFTFLFTDIEGSTQLWEQHPEAMQVALARHDTILRQAIERHSGHVFKTLGDAFYAAFANAPDAVSAALDAQRALGGDHEDHPDLIIRVRMGLHTGVAEARDNDYFGQPLNRVARLMSAGHGGQILLSAATNDLLREHLPPDADLRDMGEHALKDLPRPEHIYQLTAPGLQTDFPPLRVLDAFRSNLPVQLTSFIGREKELSAVKSLIAPSSGEGARLVTLTGSGGTGKTRLSLQVAAELLDSFADGVWFVEFAPLSDPALVPQTVLTALGLREEIGRTVLELLLTYLHTKKILLILDNCEHLVETAAQLAETLLHSCANLRLLVSSREALGIAGEKSYHLRSLSTPKADTPLNIETVTQYESVRLFVDRAQAVSAGFAITSNNISAIVQICTRLDGIPLAIELAAARVKLLRAEQIAERLDDRFRLLTGGSRTALPRQQTLRAMIDWSYDLLPEAERVLLCRLSIFAGGWALEAAETVCKDEIRSQQGEGTAKELLHPLDVLDSLTQLVNKSLVITDADVSLGGEIRYRMLETIRQYAREKLFESGGGESVRNRHLQYFMQLCERAEPEFNGPNQVIWMKRLITEMDNLRAAIEWSLEHDAQPGLRLASALRWFWVTHDRIKNGIEHLSQLLARPDASARTPARAKALAAYSILANYLDQTDLPLTLAQESFSIYQELGDPYGIADGLLNLAESYSFAEADEARRQIDESLQRFQELGDKPGMARALGMQGSFVDITNMTQAISSHKQSLKICREMGHLAGIGDNLISLGTLALRQGEYNQAQIWLNEALEINRTLGRMRTAQTLIPIGDLAVQQGHYEQARAYFEESLIILEESGQYFYVDWLRIRMGNMALKLGDVTSARRTFKESLRRFIEIDQTIGIVYSLENFAVLAILQNQLTPAAQIFAWADVIREHIQDSRPPVEQADVDHHLATIRAQIDEAALSAAQAAGRTMSMDEAIALALESTHD